MVLTVLIDDANIAVFGRSFIGHDAVDLVQLERRRLVPIADAYCENRRRRLGFFHVLGQVAFPLKLLAPNLL